MISSRVSVVQEALRFLRLFPYTSHFSFSSLQKRKSDPRMPLSMGERNMEAERIVTAKKHLPANQRIGCPGLIE
jgi:hypothetical protein